MKRFSERKLFDLFLGPADKVAPALVDHQHTTIKAAMDDADHRLTEDGRELELPFTQGFGCRDALVDVAEEHGQTAVDRHRMDLEPAGEGGVMGLEAFRCAVGHGASVAGLEWRSDEIGEGLPEAGADQGVAAPEFALGTRVQEDEAPLAVEHEDAVSRPFHEGLKIMREMIRRAHPIVE
jgi:hypothetical protein